MCSAEYTLHSAHLAGGAEELRSTRGDLHSFSNSSLEQKNMYQNVINRRAQEMLMNMMYHVPFRI